MRDPGRYQRWFRRRSGRPRRVRVCSRPVRSRTRHDRVSEVGCRVSPAARPCPWGSMRLLSSARMRRCWGGRVLRRFRAYRARRGRRPDVVEATRRRAGAAFTPPLSPSPEVVGRADGSRWPGAGDLMARITGRPPRAPDAAKAGGVVTRTRSAHLRRDPGGRSGRFAAPRSSPSSSRSSCYLPPRAAPPAHGKGEDSREEASPASCPESSAAAGRAVLMGCQISSTAGEAPSPLAARRAGRR